mmetsp:Transcript_841/g.1613  ORF Transcript_841/g.1613 Transcript_841/m.1613 type:complete len:81 (+) Transcript_841:1007-1249(+)
MKQRKVRCPARSKLGVDLVQEHLAHSHMAAYSRNVFCNQKQKQLPAKFCRACSSGQCRQIIPFLPNLGLRTDPQPFESEH